ncbi:hypothetical protein BJX63DRAFT_275696 [Aspergillus granulosus]|uniref:Secreted protein n=1 Tax=Aspergillus granulosus TaxID=176169 RepID=A0ABR4H7T9_9EURO
MHLGGLLLPGLPASVMTANANHVNEARRLTLSLPSLHHLNLPCEATAFFRDCILSFAASSSLCSTLFSESLFLRIALGSFASAAHHLSMVF